MVEEGEGIKLNWGGNIGKYEDVVGNRQLFMTTLEKLHATMGTKFMIPIIGGRDLDLHKLFVEVTSRGGIEKILIEKRWKDVTATFNFPSTATNASFVLRKYYYSLLQHYERIYYFKPQASTSTPNGVLQSSNMRSDGLPTTSGAREPRISSIEYGDGSVGSPVIGVIDGKFESGYLVTVTVGKEKMKGVLYQNQCVHNRKRRRRRRKSEIRKRDPSHPKPNRSGYNFFFAEQHARLKPLHPGQDRDISRMIGQLWNQMKDNEKDIYEEKARRDKERYMTEIRDYRERIRAGQVISDAAKVAIQENDSNSSKSDSEEEDDDEDENDDDYDQDQNQDQGCLGLPQEPNSTLQLHHIA